MGDFAKVFKELRKSRDLTQEKLAEALGISKSSVNMYERGDRRPDFETLEMIADFFNVDMNHLLGNGSLHLKEEKEPPSNAKIALSMQKLLEEKGVIPPGGDLTKEQADIILNYISANADFLKELVQKNK